MHTARLDRLPAALLAVHQHQAERHLAALALDHVECLGSCGTAPVVVVNETYHENMTVEKLDALLGELK